MHLMGLVVFSPLSFFLFGQLIFHMKKAGPNDPAFSARRRPILQRMSCIGLHYLAPAMEAGAFGAASLSILNQRKLTCDQALPLNRQGHAVT